MQRKLKNVAAAVFLSSTISAVNILVKIPTRQRPDRFFSCLDSYYAQLSGKHIVNFIISCDVDDQTMNCTQVRDKLKRYAHLKAIYAKSKSKIDAYNRDIRDAEPFDVLVLTSDDTIPIANGYDDIIATEMTKNFAKFEGVLRFNDGRTPMTSILNTLPVIGREFYERFNYAYHPDYKSFFCDLELSLVAHILGKSVAIDKVLFRHDHPLCTGTAFDELYTKNAIYWDYDMAKFKERADHVFDLRNLGPEKEAALAKLVKFCLTYVE